MSTPRGYITRLLALDSETTGVAFNCDDPSYNPKTGQTFQAVSMGLAVVDAQSLNILEELYVEIKWDGVSVWSKEAEAVHGLSKEYLATHGVDTSEAVELIGNLIINHWGPSSPICVLGHNPSFDISFLKRLMRSEGIDLRFGSKIVDTNSIGFAVYDTHNSDDLFETVGIPARLTHNALDDAKSAVRVVKVTRAIAKQCFGD